MENNIGEQVMPKVGGKSFRCECGCNVFTIIDKLKYECNSCEARYVGEGVPSRDQPDRDKHLSKLNATDFADC